MKFIVEFPARLDAFLSDQREDVSRSSIQKLIKNGGVQVNDQVITKPAFPLKEGDQIVANINTVSLRPSAELRMAQSDNVISENLKLEILYEDDHCLILNKPAGYAVHPASGMPENEVTILSGIAHLFAERSLPFSADAVLVHRLDKETTGCLLIAKHAKAHHALQKQFEERTVSKQYLALVAGIPDPPAATIDAPIGRNLTDRTKMSILTTSISRDAKTTYRVIDQTDDISLLECDLHTGRTHQIRVHLRSIGHPILGDSTYASMHSKEVTSQYDVQGICLHSWKLQFENMNGQQTEVMAALPEEFNKALDTVGINL